MLNAVPGELLRRALDLLVERLLAERLGATDRPRRSRDAAPGSRHIPRAVRRWGYTVVRGSASRGGREAMVELIRHVRAGRSLALTPDELLALYVKLREQKGGVGAAALRARTCGGCMLTLDATILKDIAARPEDDVVRCEECSRILVRTKESGLQAPA